MHTRNVNSRLICSIAACLLDRSTSLSLLQFGQSSQPRPEPVRRTDAPLTQMIMSATSATMQMLRNSFGVKPSGERMPTQHAAAGYGNAG